MRRIAITQRVDHWPDRQETRDGLDQRLTEMILAIGMLPVPVPNALRAAERASAWCLALEIDAVILSGGNDIGSCVDRDASEGALLDWASLQRCPVLGLCRGMQMMVVHTGGAVAQAEGHVGSRHELSGALPGNVNSYHNQVVARLPDCFEILARAEDDTIEAIRHSDLPWQGWMWHPEREQDYLAAGPGSHLHRMRELFRV